MPASKKAFPWCVNPVIGQLERSTVDRDAGFGTEYLMASPLLPPSSYVPAT